MTIGKGFSIGAMAAGSVALMLALIHFWMGPLSPEPAVADTIADTAVAIRDSMQRALSGAEARPPASSGFDAEIVMNLATSMLGGLAIVMGAIGIACGAPARIAGTGLALGASAVVFQFVAWIALLIVGAIVLAAIINNLGDLLSFGG
ncbi:MAG: hypothetical protein AAF899_06660 [Pseudomonadota bacterium]